MPRTTSDVLLVLLCFACMIAGGIGLKREHKLAVMPYCHVASATLAAGECK
jgi:hypothetical protein